MAQTEVEIQRQKEMQQAEELLFSGRQELGFAKGLFLGNFVTDWVMPYPRLDSAKQTELETALADVREMLDCELDPNWIDRNADIPRDLIDGLARTGVLGMTAPREVGGRGFSQMQYCRILEEIGRRDASTSVFVNAHHSIGIRALILFGSREQQAEWLPALVAGEKLAAFALTEREAGSDAANVRMTATPSDDGSHYLLNGEKRYITNAAVSEVWTVMARTPVAGKPGKDAITAFLVTPDMPGVEMIEGRMPKLGIRGTATGRFRLNNVRVPKENILGPLGKGLRVALTVLDFGRTTFGACCTGAAKHCLQLAIEHANSRQQFKKTLGNFDLVKKKIARIAADVYAMEAMTNVTASLIDRGLEDYMIETAMLKVFTTERLWEAVNDAFQIHGGSAYFDDNPLGRMLRDARINQIGEGSNEVLTSFIALVGHARAGHGVQGDLRHHDVVFGQSRRQSLERGHESAGRDRADTECARPKCGIAGGRRTAWPSHLALQCRGQPRASGLSRTGARHAVDSGANCGRGNGAFRVNLCAQPVGFGIAVAWAKWENSTARFRCSGIFSAQIDSPRQGTAGQVK